MELFRICVAFLSAMLLSRLFLPPHPSATLAWLCALLLVVSALFVDWMPLRKLVFRGSEKATGLGLKYRYFRIAAFALGLANAHAGAGKGARQAERPVSEMVTQTRDRGVSDGLVMLEVLGASEPGPTCRIEVRGALNRRPIKIEILEGKCLFSQGDRLALLVSELSRRRSVWDTGPRDISRVWRMSRGPENYWRWLAVLRWLAWSKARGDPELSFAVACVLGLRRTLDPQQRELLQGAGLGHLLAVSGLHVGVFALMSFWLALRVFGGRLGMAALAASSVVVGYMFVTGFQIPVVRAGILALVTLLSFPFGSLHRLSLLLVTLCGMLLFCPQWLDEVSFQLSAVAMVVILTTPESFPKWTMSFRLTWSLGPLTLLHFGTAPWVGAIANLLLLPFFCFWLFPTALLGLGTSLFCSAIFDAGTWLEPIMLEKVAMSPFRWGAEMLFWASWVVAELPPWSARGFVASLGVALFFIFLRRGFSQMNERVSALISWFLPPLGTFLLVPLLICSPAIGSPKAEVPGSNKESVEFQKNLGGTWFLVGGKSSDSWGRIDTRKRACLVRLKSTPQELVRLLEALGVDELGGQAMSGGRRASQLQRIWLRRGRTIVSSEAACTTKRLTGQNKIVQASAKACRKITRAKRVVVVGRFRSADAYCYNGAQWIPLLKDMASHNSKGW